MQIILDGRIKTDRGVIALGMFDGVHIGHRVLLRKARALANAANAPLVVCTFQRHPMELIAPEKAPPLLSGFEERAALLEQMGADILNAMPFDREMMNQLPECYIGQLVRHFHPTDVVCGYNHSFGRQGAGSPALLDALGCALRFRVTVVPQITLEGQPVSSTIIREALSEGRVDTARRMLQRPYVRLGKVIGSENGRCQIALQQDGKQDVAAGCYRVLLGTGEKTLPALLRLNPDGTALAAWTGETAAAPVNNEVSLGFLSRA